MKLFEKDMEAVPNNQRTQFAGCLTLYFGSEEISRCFDMMLAEGHIREGKYKTFRRMFFLDESPLAPTGSVRVRQEPTLVGTKKELSKILATREVKPRVKIPSVARQVPPVKRSLMYRIRKKLSKFLQP